MVVSIEFMCWDLFVLTKKYTLYSFQVESPSSGEFTALGIYLLTSLFLIVASFIEFFFVLHFHQRNEKHLQKQKELRSWKYHVNWSRNSGENQGNICYIVTISPKANENTMFYNYGEPLFNISKIDRLAFTFGVVLFFLFNVLYWLTFMNFKFNFI